MIHREQLNKTLYIRTYVFAQESPKGTALIFKRLKKRPKEIINYNKEEKDDDKE